MDVDCPAAQWDSASRPAFWAVAPPSAASLAASEGEAPCTNARAPELTAARMASGIGRGWQAAARLLLLFSYAASRFGSMLDPKKGGAGLWPNCFLSSWISVWPA